CPTANLVRVGHGAEVIEQKSDDETASSEAAAEVPSAFNGILQTPGDSDQFRFHARHGERIVAEVFAYRIGSPADSVLGVLDSDGSVLATNDDGGSHDSCLIFDSPATGDYLLQIRDKRLGGGPDFIYRVELAHSAPRLTVFYHTPHRERRSAPTV